MAITITIDNDTSTPLVLDKFVLDESARFTGGRFFLGLQATAVPRAR